MYIYSWVFNAPLINTIISYCNAEHCSLFHQIAGVYEIHNFRSVLLAFSGRVLFQNIRFGLPTKYICIAVSYRIVVTLKKNSVSYDVVLAGTDVSEENMTSIFNVKAMNELNRVTNSDCSTQPNINRSMRME
jgi:hypothetical protein